MPQYAVKIGKLLLKSDKPITDEQRKQAIIEFKRAFRGMMMKTRGGLEIICED